MEPIEPFAYDNAAGRIAFGRGAVADLGATLAALDADRALVVCGSNVGANRDLMAPIEDGLGDRLVGVFDETTPAKAARAAVDGVERRAIPDIATAVADDRFLDNGPAGLDPTVDEIEAVLERAW